jgi:hypothetical protein
VLKAFLSFDEFLFPRLTTIIYWIGLALIVLLTLVAAIGALVAGSNPYLTEATGYNGGFAFIMALIGGAVGLVVWRITVELWMVLFSIYEVLKQIRDRR